ncbi:hypothetical protein IFM89_010576 [Coptis chinensis]|uniref:Uncharacterized protein n=1 Tax=Coptis chinensis TaxID=261450 RepID=A0A835M5H8_9MAGN|nr:hypothetical protein IFM89_010576 [Coptis chinensis]
MDSYYSPGGSNSLNDDQLNEDMGDDATNIPGSSTSAASKKRGPSIGIEEIEGQPHLKLIMQTNRKGQPVTPIENVSEFGTRLGYIARRDIPICYDDWRHINKGIKDKVIKTLGCQFVFEYEKTIDTDYTRTSIAVARNKLALEKGIPESKITRADSYMLIHKPKETVLQSQEVLVVGPDKRGRYRGLGTGVCKTVLQKGDSLMRKNDGLMEANTLLERRMESMEVNMDAKMSRHMQEVRGMFMSQRGTFNDNVPSPHSRANHHSTTPLENAYYIGKDCELRGGWPLELVARGVVQDVDPNTEYGERTLEKGNFKVYVQVVRKPDAILPFPHNAWQRTLGQVVQGSHHRPKEFLVFASRSSSS